MPRLRQLQNDSFFGKEYMVIAARKTFCVLFYFFSVSFNYAAILVKFASQAEQQWRSRVTTAF
jgi:hypothetical protein